MSIARIARHLVSEGAARRRFPDSALDVIQRAIAVGEAWHRGQVCFAIEGALPLAELLRGRSARERAHEVFAHLRVWDTEHNSGVLIYVLIADHAIEIVADRGIAARVAEAEWQAVCAQLRERFRTDEFESGAVAAVEAVSDILASHFPADGTPVANELPDRPVRL
ncbi:MAG: TPM domain-containing protein [Proteobacteria bacterium]|nr:TPM domain-containing protein [Pseudomonadota bacterium]